jgi:hypothetical protein
MTLRESKELLVIQELQNFYCRSGLRHYTDNPLGSTQRIGIVHSLGDSHESFWTSPRPVPFISNS